MANIPRRGTCNILQLYTQANHNLTSWPCSQCDGQMWQCPGPSWEYICQGGKGRACPTCTCVGYFDEGIFKKNVELYLSNPPSTRSTTNKCGINWCKIQTRVWDDATCIVHKDGGSSNMAWIFYMAGAPMLILFPCEDAAISICTVNNN